MAKTIKEQEDFIRYAPLRIGDVSKIKRKNPLKPVPKDKEHPGYSLALLLSDPSYLMFTAKTLLNINLIPEQAVIIQELWERPFPMYVACRGFGKSFLLAVFALLKMALTPPNSIGAAGVKIVIVGAAFRQSKVIFDYMETIWNGADVLRSVCSNESGPKRDTDRCTMKINANWAIAVPLGDGSKIRGLRATVIIADEFASIPLNIYETVVQGFASVNADPSEGVNEVCRQQARLELGLITAESAAKNNIQTNQVIISGTADYEFKHFAKYWKRYKDFIASKHFPERLRQWYPDGVPDSFSADDYSIIRMPYELIPRGFMSEKVIARAKATVHSGTFQLEYGACFIGDSNGFFKRSLIESCVTSDIKPVQLPSGDVWFDATTRGNLSSRYVYGVDPASERDNFSIVVLELMKDHTRVVYCWTTNRKEFKKRHAARLTREDDFYGFCARKIRDLMKTFPCERLAIDSQGGGIAVMEALHDKAKMRDGEVQLWPVIDPAKPKDTDRFAGLHILEPIQFANADWTSTANHGLRKDLEDKVLLFPRFDPITIELALADDVERVKAYESDNPGKTMSIYDSLEDCVMEIEELKNELTSIILTRTGTGVNSRDRWDTPEIKNEGGKKDRSRKDRYSSLLMANMVARQTQRAIVIERSLDYGGFTKDFNNNSDFGSLYTGPAWWTENVDNLFGKRRK